MIGHARRSQRIQLRLQNGIRRGTKNTELHAPTEHVSHFVGLIIQLRLAGKKQHTIKANRGSRSRKANLIEIGRAVDKMVYT